MNISKCALLFTIFCLYFCQCVAASSWTLDIPSTVKALVGSCVVIPCSFDYPPPDKEVTQFTGIWTDETSHVIYHPEERKALVQYRNRTKILGDLRRKDCSLKIDPVQQSDSGSYRFRIEMAEYDNYLYKEKPVSIVTSSDPESVVFSMKGEVLLADSVSALCSVSHTCPHSPPRLTWTHAGQVEVQNQKIGGALWRTNSTLTFQPSHSDHNKRLECTVTHGGGTQQSAGALLRVKYAPEILNASSCYYEGHHVRCMCIAESYPPSEVLLLLSDRVMPNTRTEQYGLLTVVTAQTDIVQFIDGLFNSVKCIANNTLGTTDLLLSLPHSNIYIYIGVGTGAAVLILIILLIVVARKCSRRRQTDRESTSHKHNHDIGLRTEQYTVPVRKICADVDYSGSDSNDHTYGNTETFDSHDDAVYANV